MSRKTTKNFIPKDKQYFKFCFYGFFKNLKFFEPFLMLFFLSKGLSYLQIGTLYAVREISINILEIPTGIFADILGRRKTMITSFAGYIVSFVLFYFASSFALLIISMLIFSFGDAMRTGTHKAMIFDYLRIKNLSDKKITYYGHTRSWSQAGAALSSLMAAAIVIWFNNYNTVFIISTIPYVAGLLLIWSYPQELDGPIKHEQGNNKHKIKLHFKQTLQTLKNKSVWQTYFNLSLWQGYFKAVKDYLQPVIVLAAAGLITVKGLPERDKSALTIGVVYFIIYIISSLSSRHSDKVTTLFKSPEKTINITLIFGLIIGILSGLLLKNNLPASAVLFFIILYIIQNIRRTVGTGIISSKVKNNVLATGLSLQSQLDSIITAFTAISLGLLADVFSIGVALATVGVFLLFTSFFVLLKK